MSIEQISNAFDKKKLSMRFTKKSSFQTFILSIIRNSKLNLNLTLSTQIIRSIKFKFVHRNSVENVHIDEIFVSFEAQVYRL